MTTAEGVEVRELGERRGRKSRGKGRREGNIYSTSPCSGIYYPPTQAHLYHMVADIVGRAMFLPIERLAGSGQPGKAIPLAADQKEDLNRGASASPDMFTVTGVRDVAPGLHM